MIYVGSCNIISNIIDITAVFPLPLTAFFLFSLITYFMREEVFHSWARFAAPAVIISILLILITPNDSGGGFGPQLSVDKADVAILTTVVISIASLVCLPVHADSESGSVMRTESSKKTISA